MEENQDAREAGEDVSGKRDGVNPYVIPVSILIAGGLIAGAVLYANRSAPPAPPAQKAAVGAAAGVSAADLVDDDPALGDPSAPVTIVEFADFQCPFCARFALTTKKDIIEQYVKTGKARFVYRDFPLSSIHAEAQKAAEAAECADAQGKFWEYHDLLYERQAELSVAKYKEWAGALGLNQAAFSQCLDSGAYAAEVQKDFADGQAAGVRGTPGSFVNGKSVEGAQPFAVFQAAIEEALKNAQ